MMRQGEMSGLSPGSAGPVPANLAKVSSGYPVPAADAPAARRSIKQVLKSYFYWTYPRGSLHYDVMVTLILLFIFVTPAVWDYGDKPRSTAANTHPVQITGGGGYGLIVTIQASDVIASSGSSNADIKKALKKAMEPVLGDSIYVERWELLRDQNGNPQSWKIWAHR